MKRVFSNLVESATNLIEGIARLEKRYVINVRAYYDTTLINNRDGLAVRSDLTAAMASKWRCSEAQMPAMTLVPVTAMKVIPAMGSNNHRPPSASIPITAMQITAVDSIHLESDMWIHHGRS